MYGYQAGVVAGHAVIHHDLANLGNDVAQGLSNGAIWALIAIGYTLVYGIIELINFAHGDVFMIGSFTSVGLWGVFGLGLTTSALGLTWGLLATLIIAMIVTGSLNVLIERVAYRPLRNAPKLAALITAVGFSFILQNVGLLWRGGSPQSVPDLIHVQQTVFTIAGVPIQRGYILAFAVMIPLVFALGWFINRTRAGPGDARDRPGPGGRPADGHQRQRHDLAHVPARRHAGRRGRAWCTRCTRPTSGSSRASRPG